ncbi:hypothetical protein [Streptomyces sp. NPDC008001]|uniref:hypothetical protein n=1 Tax=Streptomyces sp. NPDC008001 TaxID=3364804 RepID=UPI0036EB57EC
MNRTLPTSGEVHVWCGDSHRTDALGDISLLSREEKIRCARIAGPAERRGFAAARAGARRILADLAGGVPAGVGLPLGPGREKHCVVITEGTRATPLALDLVWSAEGWLLGLALDARIRLALGPAGDATAGPRLRQQVRQKALDRLAGAESTVAPSRSSGNFSVHDVPMPGAAIAAVACSGRHRRSGPVSLVLREVPVVT